MDTYYEKLKSLGDHQDQYCAELALAKLLELPPKTVTVEHADLGRCRVVVMRDDAGAFEVPDLDPARLYVFAICDLPQGTVRFQGLLEGAQIDPAKHWEGGCYRVPVDALDDMDVSVLASAAVQE